MHYEIYGNVMIKVVYRKLGEGMKFKKPKKRFNPSESI